MSANTALPPPLQSFSARYAEEFSTRFLETVRGRFQRCIRGKAVSAIPAAGLEVVPATPGTCTVKTRCMVRFGMAAGWRSAEESFEYPAGQPGRVSADALAAWLGDRMGALADTLAAGIPAKSCSAAEFGGWASDVTILTEGMPLFGRRLPRVISRIRREAVPGLQEQTAEEIRAAVRDRAAEISVPWAVPGQVTGCRVRVSLEETETLLVQVTCTVRYRGDWTCREQESFPDAVRHLAGWSWTAFRRELGSASGGTLPPGFLARHWALLQDRLEDPEGAAAEAERIVSRLAFTCGHRIIEKLPAGEVIPPGDPGGADPQVWHLLAAGSLTRRLRPEAAVYLCGGNLYRTDTGLEVELDVPALQAVTGQLEQVLDSPAGPAPDAMSQRLLVQAADQFWGGEGLELSFGSCGIRSFTVEGTVIFLPENPGESFRSWLARVREERDRQRQLREDTGRSMGEVLRTLNPTELALFRCICRGGSLRSWEAGSRISGEVITTQASAEKYLESLSRVSFPGPGGPEPLVVWSWHRGRSGIFRIFQPGPAVVPDVLYSAVGRDYNAEEAGDIIPSRRMAWLTARSAAAETAEERWEILTVLEERFSPSMAASFARSPEGQALFRQFSGLDSEYARLFLERLPGCRVLAETLFSGRAGC